MPGWNLTQPDQFADPVLEIRSYGTLVVILAVSKGIYMGEWAAWQSGALVLP